MPSQPAWFHRLEEILEGLLVGNAAAVSRAALIVRLEPMVASPDSSLFLP